MQPAHPALARPRASRRRASGLPRGGLAACVVAAMLALHCSSEDAEQAAFTTAAVTRGAVAARVTATGTLSPSIEVQVGSQVTGRIQELLVDFNSAVHAGQVIARIDPRLFEAEVAKARASRLAARAAVKRAEADVRDTQRKSERAAALSSKGGGSEADADSTLAAYDAARASLASAQASLAVAEAVLGQAETNLGYTTIVSPIDGIVISRDVDVGQTVTASLQTPTLFTIAGDLRKMEVHTNVAEADVGRLTTGMGVEFSVDAFPLERFRGVVKEVRYAPQTVQNVVTYDAVVSVENVGLELRPGMTADVSFLVAERENVLLVPNAALRFVPPEGVLERVGTPPAALGPHRIVWLLDPSGGPRPVQVKIGITDGRSTEILEGLTEGQEVVVGSGGGEEERAGRPRFGHIL